MQVDAGLVAPQGVSGTFCGGDISPSITIQNNGLTALTTATIIYGYDGNLNQSYPWQGNLSQWQSEVITLPTASLGAGNHTFTAQVSNLNGGSADENANNNEVTGSFNVVIGGQGVDLNLTLDCYGSETSWSLVDQNANTVYVSGGYQDDTPGLVVEPWCLNDGCYTFTIEDSYGDGLFGGFWCGSDGSIAIIQDGTTLAELLEADANFGSSTSLSFCIGDNGIQNANMASVVLFPNPSNNQVTVSAPFNMNEMLLMNQEGKILLNAQLNTTSTSIDLSAIASGIYFLQIRGLDASIQTLRLVKK